MHHIKYPCRYASNDKNIDNMVLFTILVLFVFVNACLRAHMHAYGLKLIKNLNRPDCVLCFFSMTDWIS